MYIQSDENGQVANISKMKFPRRGRCLPDIPDMKTQFNAVSLSVSVYRFNMNIPVARLTLIPTCCTTPDLDVINVKFCRHVLGQKVLIRTAYRWREYWVWARHTGRHLYQVYCFKGKRWNDVNTFSSDTSTFYRPFYPWSLHKGKSKVHPRTGTEALYRPYGRQVE